MMNSGGNSSQSLWSQPESLQSSEWELDSASQPFPSCSQDLLAQSLPPSQFLSKPQPLPGHPLPPLQHQQSTAHQTKLLSKQQTPSHQLQITNHPYRRLQKTPAHKQQHLQQQYLQQQHQLQVTMYNLQQQQKQMQQQQRYHEQAVLPEASSIHGLQHTTALQPALSAPGVSAVHQQQRQLGSQRIAAIQDHRAPQQLATSNSQLPLTPTPTTIESSIGSIGSDGGGLLTEANSNNTPSKDPFVSHDIRLSLLTILSVLRALPQQLQELLLDTSVAHRSSAEPELRRLLEDLSSHLEQLIRAMQIQFDKLRDNASTATEQCSSRVSSLQVSLHDTLQQLENSGKLHLSGQLDQLRRTVRRDIRKSVAVIKNVQALVREVQCTISDNSNSGAGADADTSHQVAGVVSAISILQADCNQNTTLLQDITGELMKMQQELCGVRLSVERLPVRLAEMLKQAGSTTALRRHGSAVRRAPPLQSLLHLPSPVAKVRPQIRPASTPSPSLLHDPHNRPTTSASRVGPPHNTRQQLTDGSERGGHEGHGDGTMGGPVASQIRYANVSEVILECNEDVNRVTECQNNSSTSRTARLEHVSEDSAERFKTEKNNCDKQTATRRCPTTVNYFNVSENESSGMKHLSYRLCGTLQDENMKNYIVSKPTQNNETLNLNNDNDKESKLRLGDDWDKCPDANVFDDNNYQLKVAGPKKSADQLSKVTHSSSDSSPDILVINSTQIQRTFIRKLHIADSAAHKNCTSSSESGHVEIQPIATAALNNNEEELEIFSLPQQHKKAETICVNTAVTVATEAKRDKVMLRTPFHCNYFNTPRRSHCHRRLLPAYFAPGPNTRRTPPSSVFVNYEQNVAIRNTPAAPFTSSNKARNTTTTITTTVDRAVTPKYANTVTTAHPTTWSRGSVLYSNIKFPAPAISITTDCSDRPSQPLPNYSANLFTLSPSSSVCRSDTSRSHVGFLRNRTPQQRSLGYGHSEGRHNTATAVHRNAPTVTPVNNTCRKKN